MGIFDVFKKQFIDVIEWQESEEGVLSWRYPMMDNEIQNGGKLTVRESQTALFVDEGKVADLFGPGLHTLNTKTLPILTTLKNWDKMFQSPFKSDVYFFSTRDQVDLRWGTTNPITIRDKQFGHIRLRAHGTYSYKIEQPQLFFTKVCGTREKYTIAELDGQLRSTILTDFSSFFGQSDVDFLDMAANQTKFSELMQAALSPDFETYGLKLQTFFVENLSLPQELQDYLDKSSQMNMLGDLKRYATFQSADSISIAAANEGGGAGMGVGLGAGVAMGQQMMNNLQGNQTGGGSSEEDVFAKIEKLHELHKKGILSEEEFNQKKQDLLKKI